MVQHLPSIGLGSILNNTCMQVTHEGDRYGYDTVIFHMSEGREEQNLVLPYIDHSSHVRSRAPHTLNSEKLLLCSPSRVAILNDLDIQMDWQLITCIFMAA